jgi:hypothetical protein
MRVVAVVLGICVLTWGAPALADEKKEAEWKTFQSDEYGFRMAVPEKTKMVAGKWNAWGGFYARLWPVHLWGIAKLGTKHTAAEIEAFGLTVTKTKPKHWKLIAQGKDKQGFEWFKIQKAQWLDHVAIAVYGVGPKGSYLLVLKTKKANYLLFKTAYDRWAQSVQLF